MQDPDATITPPPPHDAANPLASAGGRDRRGPALRVHAGPDTAAFYALLLALHPTSARLARCYEHRLSHLLRPGRRTPSPTSNASRVEPSHAPTNPPCGRPAPQGMASGIAPSDQEGEGFPDARGSAPRTKGQHKPTGEGVDQRDSAFVRDTLPHLRARVPILHGPRPPTPPDSPPRPREPQHRLQARRSIPPL